MNRNRNTRIAPRLLPLMALMVLALVAAIVLAACGGAAPAAPAATQAPAATEAPAQAVQATSAPAATQAPAATEAPAAAEAPSTNAPQNDLFSTPTPATDASGAASGGVTAPPAAPTSAPPRDQKPTPTPLATASPEAVPEAATVAPAAPAAPEAPTEAEAAATAIPLPTLSPSTEERSPTASQSQSVEPRVVELEWPPNMRLGESDLVRLALIPSQNGYTLTTEFEGNKTVTKTVEVPRPVGYTVSAIGRLDGVGFDIGPQAEQTVPLPANETATLRWTISPKAAGQQRLSLLLLLRWIPTEGNGQPQDVQAYSRGLNVQVNSILGMTTAQASTTGLLGLALGGGMGALALALLRTRGNIAAAITKAVKPNGGLTIEPHPGIKLGGDEEQMLRTLFRKYARVSVEREFRSGYSGARTLLCLPVRADGRSDAYTIAKMGERRSIEREFANYETFVKDTLPPVTARIQEPPVTLTPIGISSQAVLRYTFIGEPGQMPMSLRESLLNDPNPALLKKLFDTFGPNWWLQRRPYSFRLSQEYDRVLPSHLVIEPVESGARNPIQLRGNTSPADMHVNIGDLVQIRDFPLIEQRPNGMSYSLTGEGVDGQPPLRLRLNSTSEPRKAAQIFRVIGTRATLLREFTQGFDLLGLPDPFEKLDVTVHRTVSGTQSPIHGDLNLENVLVGPGGFVWLIDFAATRDGHPLFDFARLEAEIITQIAARQMPSPQAFLALLQQMNTSDGGRETGIGGLIQATRDMARQCLFNPLQPREYWMALYLACLGALKFTNLDDHQRHFLYLAAAHVAQLF